MSTRYRITFEMVDPWKAPGVTEYYPTDLIPEEMWSEKPVIVETDNPWDQYRQLKEWADAGIGGVRNVKLEKAVVQDPNWKEV